MNLEDDKKKITYTTIYAPDDLFENIHNLTSIYIHTTIMKSNTIEKIIRPHMENKRV